MSGIFLIAAIVIVLKLWSAARERQRAEQRAAAERRIRQRISDATERVAKLVSRHFLVQACTRCQEGSMLLLEISPNARSLHYQCRHCDKKLRAAAASPDAQAAATEFEQLRQILVECAGFGSEAPVVFDTPEGPLPFDKTTRGPINDATRAEVWRRDQGRCVSCGSNQNLEFDHIIPVSRGGATSPVNLQLLCRGCNRQKAANI